MQLKKLMCLSAVLVLAALLHAQTDSLLPLLGSLPVNGKVTELKIINDPDGGAYVLYIEDGLFKAARFSGGIISAFVPEGLPPILESAEDIQLGGTGPTQYAAVTSGTGTKTIHLLYLDFRGELSVLPLQENTYPSLERYALVTGNDYGLALYCLAGGVLFCTDGIDDQNSLQIKRQISLPGEYVRAFGVSSDINCTYWYGWYTGGGKTVLFSRNENGLASYRTANTAPAASSVNIISHADGSSVIRIINGVNVSVYRGDQGIIRPAYSFDAPYPVTGYEEFYTANGNNDGVTGSYNGGTVICDDSSGKYVYSVSDLSSGAPVFCELLVLEKGAADPVFLYTMEQDIIMLYNSGNTVYSLPFPALSAKRIGNGVISGFINGETPQLALYDKTTNSAEALQYSDKNWSGVKRISLPDDIPPVPGDILPDNIFSSIFFDKNDTCVITVTDGMLLINTKTGQYQIIPGTDFTVSHKINGIIFSGTFSGNSINIYYLEDQP
ncbi:hypothetical protein FACS1894151_03670 [Spirochaetia bacterium]|nr:hypothetical protein FACS1894151_03670 [Spirochaetia bacterium]